MDDKEIAERARQDARKTLLNLLRSCGLKESDEYKVDLFIEQIIAAAVIDMALELKRNDTHR